MTRHSPQAPRSFLYAHAPRPQPMPGRMSRRNWALLASVFVISTASAQLPEAGLALKLHADLQIVPSAEAAAAPSALPGSAAGGLIKTSLRPAAPAPIAASASAPATLAAPGTTEPGVQAAAVAPDPTPAPTVPTVLTNADLAPAALDEDPDGILEHVAPGLDSLDPSDLELKSMRAVVIGQDNERPLFAKNANDVAPIASITKIMTAMVILDAKLPMGEEIRVTSADIDRLRYSSSRLPVGTTLSREEMLALALMASENRAASSLAHSYPGGEARFIAAMNTKARALGMTRTRFYDATGLNGGNVSTANDLVKMVKAAYAYPEIRTMSAATSRVVTLRKGRHGSREFRNTNLLVRQGKWSIGLSKTGYINEAGHCLVMQAQIADKPLIIVLLKAVGKASRVADATRIRHWIEKQKANGQMAQKGRRSDA